MMNIEIANRLLQYRKRMGLSQEELAEKIGVSRQAVSKWERAEASPDTDNLIELSKVYGVTLDEMLRGGAEEAQTAEESAADKMENTASSDNNTEVETETDSYDGGFNINDNGDRVHIGFDGIHVHDKHGKKVDVSRSGIFVEENGEQKVYTGADGHIHKSSDVLEKEQEHARVHGNIWMKLPYPIVAVIAYVLFGVFNVMGGWAYGWIVFLTIPLYYTLVEAVLKRKAKIFCYPVLVAAVYLVIGFAFDWWHPGWVLFLTIPIFYWVTNR